MNNSPQCLTINELKGLKTEVAVLNERYVTQQQLQDFKKDCAFDFLILVSTMLALSITNFLFFYSK